MFDRKLPFNEVGALTEMAKGLKRTTGCKVVQVVVVDNDGKAKIVVSEGGEDNGKDWEGELPQSAEGAVPGQPTFHFENVSA